MKDLKVEQKWSIDGIELVRYITEKGEPRTAPLFRCCTCDEIIEDAGNAIVIWDYDSDKAQIVHVKKCDTRKLNLSQHLSDIFKMLGENSNIDYENIDISWHGLIKP